MPTGTQIKTNTNTLIRLKTEPRSILKGSVADQLDAAIDYVDQEFEKVASKCLIYRGKLFKDGVNFSLIDSENTTGQNFIAYEYSPGIVAIQTDDTSNFMTEKSFANAKDNEVSKDVLIKSKIASLNTVYVAAYYNGSGNSNFINNVDVEFLIYPTV